MWIWQGLYLGWIVHIACSRTFSQKNNKSIEKLHRVCLWGYGRTFKALLVVICKGRYGPPERSCRRNRARFFDFPHQRKTWALLGMCRFPFELPWISWMTRLRNCMIWEVPFNSGSVGIHIYWYVYPPLLSAYTLNHIWNTREAFIIFTNCKAAEWGSVKFCGHHLERRAGANPASPRTLPIMRCQRQGK